MKIWVPLAGLFLVPLLALALFSGVGSKGRASPTVPSRGIESPEVSATRSSPANSGLQGTASFAPDVKGGADDEGRAARALENVGAGDGSSAIPSTNEQTSPSSTSVRDGRQGGSEIEERLRRSKWRAPGQCLDALTMQRRQEYLSGFKKWNQFSQEELREQRTSIDVRAASGVSERAIQHSVLTMTSAERTYPEVFSVPTVYLHASLEEMQRFACVADSAVSYYDGAIHAVVLSDYEELRKSLRHEFAHHMLTELGVSDPLWFHEGYAQLFAQESPKHPKKRPRLLDLTTMLGPLRVSSTSEDVSEFYYQSVVMMRFLAQLGPKLYSSPESLMRELVTSLAEGRATAEELFLWETRRRTAGVWDGPPEDLWLHYYSEGKLPEEVKEGLRLRGRY